LLNSAPSLILLSCPLSHHQSTPHAEQMVRA
jgi:integrase